MKLLVLTLILALFATLAPAQYDNPFIRMESLPQRNAADELDRIVYKDIDLRDSLWMEQTAAQMHEAAKATGNRKWKLEADYFRAEYNFHRTVYLFKPNQQEMEQLSEKHITNLTAIARQSRSGTFSSDIHLRAVYGIFNHYLHFIKNYELAFRKSHEVDKLLSAVSADEFPPKPRYYFEIANLYYSFRQYDTAAHYYQKVLESPEMARHQRILERTWNDLGLIYRNHHNDLAASDSCFNRILTLPPEDIWAAIAGGNLGHNASLRGEYDRAIPLLQHAMERVVRNNSYNYPYAAGKALVLTHIYLEKGNLDQAVHYVGQAYGFLDQSRKNDKVEGVIKDTYYWAEYYQTVSRYHRMRHDFVNALLYADSSHTARMMFEEEFNTRKLHLAEQQVQEERHIAEKARNRMYYLFASGLCLLLIILLVAAVYHNRTIRAKNRRLYQQIKEADAARRSLDAASHNSPIPTLQGGDASQHELVHRLRQYLLTDGNLTRSDITRDDITTALGTNRNILSEAVKTITGRTLMEYIRSIQLEEARHRLDNEPELTVEAIVTESGLNINTFYRLFRKYYGMSPAEYRRLGRQT